MNDPHASTPLNEIRHLLREQDARQQKADLAFARLEAGVAEIKRDVAEIKQQGSSDHDEIVRLQSQVNIRSAGAFFGATIVSIAAMLGWPRH